MRNKFFYALLVSLLNITCPSFAEMPLENIIKQAISAQPENDPSSAFAVSASKKSKKSEWIKFKRQCGNETIAVSFPGYPKVKTEDGLVKTFSTEKHVQYTLLTPITPLSLDATQFFHIALECVERNGFSIINYEICSLDDYDLMDLIVKDKKNGNISKSRMIVTPDNFYGLETVFKPKYADNHTKFIHSFFITK